MEIINQFYLKNIFSAHPIKAFNDKYFSTTTVLEKLHAVSHQLDIDSKKHYLWLRTEVLW